MAENPGQSPPPLPENVDQVVQPIGGDANSPLLPAVDEMDPSSEVVALREWLNDENLLETPYFNSQERL